MSEDTKALNKFLNDYIQAYESGQPLTGYSEEEIRDNKRTMVQRGIFKQFGPIKEFETMQYYVCSTLEGDLFIAQASVMTYETVLCTSEMCSDGIIGIWKPIPDDKTGRIRRWTDTGEPQREGHALMKISDAFTLLWAEKNRRWQAEHLVGKLN